MQSHHTNLTTARWRHSILASLLGVATVTGLVASGCGVDPPDLDAIGPAGANEQTAPLVPSTLVPTTSAPDRQGDDEPGGGPEDDQPDATGDRDAAEEGPETTTATSLDGVGDPYFPGAGNGGYDAIDYDLTIRYDPDSDRLDGRASVTLEPTVELSRFNLDYRGPEIGSITIDDVPAGWDRQGQELVITPTVPLRADIPVLVTVDYGGVMPDTKRSFPSDEGWVNTAEGSYVASEPDGSPSWFPVNDHPTDKATYTFRITVPENYQAVANGVLTGRAGNDEGTEWVWRASDPMASYLATVVIGRFERNTHTSESGVTIDDWIAAELPDRTAQTFERSAEMLDVFEGFFGPYPFETYGHVVVDFPLNFALETQTRSLFGSDLTGGRLAILVIAHELAHQWFGNHVSPAEWDDIWLNEGWASYAEMLWFEHSEGMDITATYRNMIDDGRLDTSPPGDPGPDRLFDGGVYQRGGLTLHALRLTIGDDAFFRLARQWNERYGGSTASTADLTALAEEVSGQDLGSFFQSWLFETDLPDLPE